MKKSKWTERSSDIASMVPYWDKVGAIVDGYEAVRDSGEKYLPRFTNETNEEYQNRLNHTKLTNVYRDVLEGLASKPFESEVTLLKANEMPEDLIQFLENVDGTSNTITTFSMDLFFDAINDAVQWIFVDYPTVKDGEIVTMYDKKRAGIQPYWTRVLAINVLEVKSRVVGGKEIIEYIRIYEPDVPGFNRVRIFERMPDGTVMWKVMIESTNDKDATFDDGFRLEDSGTLSINVIPLVPFYTGRRNGRKWSFKPAMRDAADLQIDLYQDESALKFIKTMAGYPMLAANGMKPEKESDGKTVKKVAVGPMKVLYGLPDNSGKAGSWNYIEPAATSMDFLQRSVDQTKKDIREIGRQPLTAQSGQLTNTTTAVAAGKARSAVSAWAIGLKNALEIALMITCEYMKKTGLEPEVNVYNDFDSFIDSTTDQDTLLKMRELKDISAETLYTEMQRRKVLSPEFDAEEEKKRILDEVPSGELVDPNQPTGKIPAPKNPAK